MPSNLSTLTLSCIGAGRLGKPCADCSPTLSLLARLLIPAPHPHSWPQALLEPVRGKAITLNCSPPTSG